MDLMYTIKRPLLTEKSTRLSSDAGRYSFEVDRRATKTDIKKAVETLYKVKVVKINTIVQVGRRKMNKFGLVGGATTKKALVKLKEGQTIELF
jgi:large subunit ribosomal protein L23